MKKVIISVLMFSMIFHAYSQGDFYVAAYVWPSCHDDPIAREKIWTEGRGEWEVINRGNPRYPGHYQPKEPLWGYEMDNDPNVIEKWIELATNHGVNVFIYDWYWYNGGPFLESALNDGFLKARNNEEMYFYLMWANHSMPLNLVNVHLYQGDNSIVWEAAVDWENYKIIVERVIRQYFTKPNYFKIDGYPVFGVFDIGKLLQSFGGSVEETRKGLDYFREEAKKAGLPGVHFQWNPSGNQIRTAERIKRDSEFIEAIGFDSVTTYNMEGMDEDYITYGSQSQIMWDMWDETLNIPYFPCISVGWDDTPRFPRKGREGTVHYNKSPQTFATMLYKAKEFASRHPNRTRLITINAWNEWVEGSYLLPDMKYGFDYLEAVRDVMNGKYDR